ncbi:hypothetical protein BCR35DRAFT_280386 [Leucosporidium creatinivorum]|uniref:Stretch-activated Ca2+-permeable channel component-domain-containing protein n=1 Tax=Leucosporidium creatinivorum TaxID=106004 RepID=A0A1Y2EZI1_9BASI|nr:hypothetical protein BCR35DRAFT_280386 [Leucosporidium creatinivorum]
MPLTALPLLSALILAAQAAPFPQATARPPSLALLEQQSIPLNLTSSLVKKGYEVGDVPYFPTDIPSCGVCEPSWSSISSCAAAAPAFESWMNMIYNPAAWYAVIKCGCADTFQAAYPQCVDCFVQTNQCEQFLGVPSDSGASSILDGIRNVCGLGSAILGGVATSQVSAGISYTYTAEPSQGYPTTTSYGPGGMDLGSAQGASSGAGRVATEFGLLATIVVALWVL